MNSAAKVAKLYLHLGPPKTATTALQLALQSGHSSYTYLGKMHPRESGPSERSLLYKAVSGARIDCVKAEPAVERIRDLLKSERDVVLSEEMFLVDSEVTHQQKVGRLAELTKGLPVVAMITLRDPVEALPSLFQERHRKLPLSQKLSFDAFVKSNQAKVFDYAHLSGLLEAFSEMRILSFEDLTSGTPTLRDIFGSDYSDRALPSIREANIGEKGAAGRKLKSVQLGDVVRSSSFLPDSLKEGLRNVGFLQRMWRRLSAVQLMRGAEKELVVPDEIARDLRQKWLQLKERHG